MKKLFVYFLLVCFILCFNLNTAVFAKEKYKNIKNSDLQIVQKGEKYGLIRKIDNYEILPLKYKKIKKIKLKDDIFILAEKENSVSLYSPSGFYNDFLKKYYSSNDYIKNISFEGYPDYGTIIYKEKNNYGFINIDNNSVITISPPKYKKIVYPDMNSAISTLLNVSYAPLESIIVYQSYSPTQKRFMTAQDIIDDNIYYYNQGTAIPLKPLMLENVSFSKNRLNIKYQNMDFSGSKYTLVKDSKNLFLLDNTNNKMFKYKNIKLEDNDLKSEIYSLENLYSNLSALSSVEPENYPDEGIVRLDKKFLIFGKNNQHKVLYTQNISSFGDDILLNKITNINLSFQNLDNIIIQDDGLYGIIDMNGKVKVPFVYDEIRNIGCNFREIITNIENKNADKLKIKYIKNSDLPNLYIVKKNAKYGLIDENNNILIPFEYVKQAENADLTLLKNEINKKCERDDKPGKMESFSYALMYFILLPLAIVLPYPYWLNSNISIKY